MFRKGITWATAMCAMLGAAASVSNADMVGFKFETEIPVIRLGGPTGTYPLVFTVQYDPDAPGTPNGGSQMVYEMSGTMTLAGHEVNINRVFMEVSETPTKDSISIHYRVEDPLPSDTVAEDGLPYSRDLNEMDLGWADSSRQMLDGTDLPPTLDDPKMTGLPWGIQVESYKSPSAGWPYDVYVIDNNANSLAWEPINAVPEPTSLMLLVAAGLVVQRRQVFGPAKACG